MSVPNALGTAGDTYDVRTHHRCTDGIARLIDHTPSTNSLSSSGGTDSPEVTRSSNTLFHEEGSMKVKFRRRLFTDRHSRWLLQTERDPGGNKSWQAAALAAATTVAVLC